MSIDRDHDMERRFAQHEKNKLFIRQVLMSLLGFVVVVALLLGVFSVWKAVSRYQHRADAANRVRISSIEIRNQSQRIQVAKQRAEIRRQNAIGVREAQDEIAKTLTPLYVQFEMVEALKAIATSGSNNSVVYIPAGANGIPLIADANPNKVGTPKE